MRSKEPVQEPGGCLAYGLSGHVSWGHIGWDGKVGYSWSCNAVEVAFVKGGSEVSPAVEFKGAVVKEGEVVVNDLCSVD